MTTIAPVVTYRSVRILITGITGFVGSHLAEFALAQGAEVIGSVRWRSPLDGIAHLRDRLTLVESDLRDASSVRALVERHRAGEKRLAERVLQLAILAESLGQLHSLRD